MRRLAFTLMELILVLVIMATLAGVALPSMLGVRDKAAVDDAATGLLSLMHQAQALAVRDAAAHRVVIDTLDAQAWIERRDPTGYTRLNGDDTLTWDSRCLVKLDLPRSEAGASAGAAAGSVARAGVGAASRVVIDGVDIGEIVMAVDGLHTAGAVTLTLGERTRVLAAASPDADYRVTAGGGR